MAKDENFQKILEAKRWAQDYQENKGDNWRFDNEQLNYFEDFFAGVLKGVTLQELVDRLREENGEVLVANFFGGTQVLEDLGLDSGVAVRLEEKEHPDQYQVVSGDLVTKKIWDDIPNNIDVVVSMPRGALFFLPDSNDVNYFLLNNLYKKMNPESSIALLQVAQDSKDDLIKWAEAVEQVEGLSIRYHQNEANSVDQAEYFSVAIIRSSGSPRELPKI